MQAETLDEVNANYSFLGVQLREQIDKKIIKQSNILATVRFIFKDMKDDLIKVMFALFKRSQGYWIRNNYIIIEENDYEEFIKAVNDVPELIKTRRKK